MSRDTQKDQEREDRKNELKREARNLLLSNDSLSGTSLEDALRPCAMKLLNSGLGNEVITELESEKIKHVNTLREVWRVVLKDTAKSTSEFEPPDNATPKSGLDWVEELDRKSPPGQLGNMR